ncbi:dihydrolipoamide acetyltransferase family protein [Candidatus Nanohalococcus occultus]|uniref:Pyruvate/2-oxoglutarate dehydrogenase complex, dihydrolipoamide acyltransferase (E2) component or related enzyme n=1 Tax=Candidatus Nanohalococcus occultus TaxID=2978047 RepID=A0ABY8CCZ8_9ARCH|nr:Pyruvate/2-oxoglutarate dehydrogenase complex, dihydrolipoamide acyltransferase (E2) component or related enzyme [Candidatus Nanohaloarchaeota archaeon SVXNc]
MKFEFPDTGEGVTEGEFLQWLVEEGEDVEEDQAVAEAETDKAVIDIPAPADGTIQSLKASPGDTVKVGDVIMELDTVEPSKEVESEEDTESEEKQVQETSEDELYSRDRVLALPKARKLAEEKGVDLESLEIDGRIREKDVLNAAESDTGGKDSESTESTEPDQKIMATPSVRKLAREKEIDIQEVEGSGRGGKITRDDVLSFIEEGASHKSTDRTFEDDGGAERVEMSKLRKTVASRMEKSRFTAPHVTHVEKADLEELSAMRDRVNESSEQHLTYLPFVIKALVEALEKHPDLNAELDESNEEIVRYSSFDFNVAVDTEKGLMVPLIREVGEKSIVDIASEIEEKAEKAQDGDLSSSEMENGTFSVTNLGVIGGEEFTPIINYPQTAILGLGKISETAEVIDGEIQPRKTVKLSLSYDHRVVDGADAARFVNDVVENLENPEKLLVNL